MNAELRPIVGDMSKLKMFGSQRFAMGLWERELGDDFQAVQAFRSTRTRFGRRARMPQTVDKPLSHPYHILSHPYHTPQRLVKLPEKRSINH